MAAVKFSWKSCFFLLVPCLIEKCRTVHVWQTHMNRLNAAYLVSICTKLLRCGWHIGVDAKDSLGDVIMDIPHSDSIEFITLWPFNTLLPLIAAAQRSSSTGTKLRSIDFPDVHSRVSLRNTHSDTKRLKFAYWLQLSLRYTLKTCSTCFNSAYKIPSTIVVRVLDFYPLEMTIWPIYTYALLCMCFLLSVTAQGKD